MVVIDVSGDLTIRVVEYDDRLIFNNDQEPVVRQTTDFQVRRETLIAKSPVFNKMLTSNFAEAKKDIVTLEGDTVTSMDIWFRTLHTVRMGHTQSVPIEEMWHLVAACDKYNLNIRELHEWFAEWYEKMARTHPARELLYPCWIFDHAKGFASATKALAYGSIGHITESNPTEHRELHLPSRVIQQINAAKGRLRTVLHRDLFKPNERLLQATCSCKEKTLYDYEKDLYRIKVWPLERVAQQNSIRMILSSLDMFNYKPPKEACSKYCLQDYKAIVAGAQALTRNYFEGLCLDYMDSSNPKTGNADTDYWRHNSLSESEWVRGCRFPHKQPTWYFSFMGRKEEQDRFRQKKPAGRRGREDSLSEEEAH